MQKSKSRLVRTQSLNITHLLSCFLPLRCNAWLVRKDDSPCHTPAGGVEDKLRQSFCSPLSCLLRSRERDKKVVSEQLRSLLCARQRFGVGVEFKSLAVKLDCHARLVDLCIRAAHLISRERLVLSLIHI